MSFQLYDYQQSAEDEVRQSFYDGHNAVILCIPTGGGKTVVFSDIARKATDLGNTVMIVCDRKELINQSFDKLKDYGLHPSKIIPSRAIVKNNCYVASVDTLLRRKLDIDIDILIIDEAHKAKFDKLIDQYKGRCLIIGATATPVRVGQQRSLDTLYDHIVNPVSVKDLIGLGKLSPAIYYGAKVDLSELNAKNSGRQEYRDGDLFEFFDKSNLYEGVVDNYVKFGNGEPAIVFNVNREHSKKTAEEFNRRGIKAAHVDGSFSDFERARILNGFKSGLYQVVCNCSILTTGYDAPFVVNVIVNRATKSLSLWLQMCGRGSRIMEGKSEFRIIDMGSNIQNLGFWDDDREYSLSKKTKRKGLDAAPVKECEVCEALVHASVPVCPHCGSIFPKKIKKLKTAEFMQITRDSIPSHLRKPFADMDFHELEEYRKLSGYKSGWTQIQMTLKKAKEVNKVSLNR